VRLPGVQESGLGHDPHVAAVLGQETEAAGFALTLGEHCNRTTARLSEGTTSVVPGAQHFPAPVN